MLEGYVHIPSGTTAVIDLSGFTIDGEEAETDKYSVVKYANVIISDKDYAEDYKAKLIAEHGDRLSVYVFLKQQYHNNTIGEQDISLLADCFFRTPKEPLNKSRPTG